jgi:hypothetical protein
VRIFLDTPHAPDTFVLQRSESAEVSAEDPVDTGSTENDFLVELELESLMHQHTGKPHLTRTHVKLVRNLIDMRSRFGLYLETLIFGGLDGFSFQVPSPLQTHRRGGICRTNISSLRPEPNIRPEIIVIRRRTFLGISIEEQKSERSRLRRFSPSRKTLTSELRE